MTPDAALARRFGARAIRGALPWSAVFAVVVWSSAATFATAYPTALQRASLAASLRANVGLTALFGPMHRLDTVWGFTAWRSIGVLSIVGAIWGVLSGSRTLRGEEDDGRWELVLAGGVNRRRAAAAAVAGAAAGPLWLWCAAVAAVTAARSDAAIPWPTGLAVATALVLPAAMFFAVALICGQLLPSRRAAARAAAASFGIAYLIRIVAVATGEHWLGWLTPLGWIDRLHPLTGVALVPLTACVGLLAGAVAATVWLAGRRDAGAAVVRTRRERSQRSVLLGSLEQFSLRLALPAAAGWTLALATISTVLGLVAHSVSTLAGRSAFIRSLAARIGAADGSRLFLGIAITLVISAVALAAAGFAAAIREDENARQVELVLPAPVGRSRWLLGRVTVAAVALALFGLVIGMALWGASAASGSPIPLATLLAAGINVVPAALLVLGAAVFCYGVVPRATALVGYGIVAWSFLVQLVGSMLAAPTWLLDLSLLHHVAVAPAANPQWGTDTVLVGLAVAAAGLGVVAFRRRDIGQA